MDKLLCSAGMRAVSLTDDGTIIVEKIFDRPYYFLSDELRQLLRPYGYKGKHKLPPLVRLAESYVGCQMAEFEAAIVERCNKAKRMLCSDCHDKMAWLAEDGTIKVEHLDGVPSKYFSEELQQMFLSHNYRVMPDTNALVRLVFSFAGQPISSLEAEIGRREKRRDATNAREERKKALFAKLPAPLQPLIVGIDSIEFYPTGFSVYVNLNTSYPLQQQRLLLRRGKHDIARWLKDALADQRSADAHKAVGLLPLSRITSWALGRENYAVYRYELNERLLALAGDEAPE